MSEDQPPAIEWPAGINPEDNWELVASYEELVAPKPRCRCSVLPIEGEPRPGD